MSESSNQNILNTRYSASVHDKAQAELRFQYVFDKDALKQKRLLGRKEDINQDIYIVFPGQWYVSEKSFPADEFIAEMTHHIRFSEPMIKMSFVMPKEFRKENPYYQLILNLEQYASNPSKKLEQNIFKLIRSFTAGYASQFTRRINSKLDRLQGMLDSEDDNKRSLKKIQKVVFAIEQTVHASYLVMRNWRALIFDLSQKMSDEQFKDIWREFSLVDEYCSALFVDGIGGIYKVLAHRGLNDIEAEIRHPLDSLQFTMRSHLRLEHMYQRKQNFKMSYVKTRVDKEYALSRIRALKRHIWSVLYTQSNLKKKIPVGQHFGAAIAASFAAVWAFSANLFVIFNYPEIISGGGRNLKTLLGANGVLAIAIIVLAYVVKDRIKEIGRGFFKQFTSHSYDQVMDVSYSTEEAQKLAICQIKERALYEVHSELPTPAIQLLKKHGIEVEIDLAERSSILHLNRDLSFNLEGIRDAQTPSTGLSDIIRINFGRFQSIMGDPKKQMYVVDEEGDITSMRLPKVYYCDMIIVNSSSSLKTKYHMVRFVLSKKGLIRCDTLA